MLGVTDGAPGVGSGGVGASGATALGGAGAGRDVDGSGAAWRTGAVTTAAGGMTGAKRSLAAGPRRAVTAPNATAAPTPKKINAAKLNAPQGNGRGALVLGA